MTTNSLSSIPLWRFILPLLFQIGLIMAVPAQAVYILVTGRTVILQTEPVDPYDLLRGYSQTLSYDISNYNSLENLPGWNTLLDDKTQDLKMGTKLYVILEAPKKNNLSDKLPPAWKAVKVSDSLPKNLPSNQIALLGVYEYNSIRYDLETYYFPEDQREKINNDINKLQWQQGKHRPFVVEVKIDERGESIPVSLWIGNNNYRF